MKLARLLPIVLFASLGFGATVSGKLSNPDTSGAIPGFIQFDLENCGGNYPLVSGFSITPQQKFNLASDGTWTGTLDRNDQIGCNGDTSSNWWHVTYFVNFRQVGPGRDVRLTSVNCASSCVVDGITPLVVLPTIPTGTGDNTYLRLDGGNQPNPYVFTQGLSVNGPFTSAGSNSFIGSNTFQNLENIRYADAFAGGDCGAKITAANTALGGTAGEIVVNQSCGLTWTTVPTLSANHVLLFIQGGTYSMAGDLNVPSGGAVICDNAATVLKMPTVSGDHNIITINGVNDTSVTGCTLDGTGMTATGANSHLIRVINAANFIINSNKLINSPEDAIRLGSSTIAGAATQGRITNNRIDTPGTIGPSGSCIGADNVRTTIIDHNQCTNAALDGIDIEPTDSTRFGDQVTIVDNYVGGKAGSSNGISLFNNFVAVSQQNAVVGNVIQNFIGGTCVILRGQIDDTVTGNTMLGCVNGVLFQTSGGGGGGTSTTVVSSNALKSNTTGIDIDGASSINNLVVANNINNSTTGITETTSAGTNTFLSNKFSANSNNFGTINGNSVVGFDTGNGGYTFIIPGQNTACFNLQDVATSPTHRQLLCPNLPATAFNGIVQGGDAALLYNSTQGYVVAPNSGTSGLRLDGSGNAIETGSFRSKQNISDQGSACTNGELALSAGWQSTGSATVTAVAGTGQTCSWTITTGTTTAANPTITDTLTNALPTANTVCWMNIYGGTHTAVAGESLRQTTLSATAPIFTANFTPTAAGTTYFVTRGCGP